jgi:hypothetical protein
MLHQVNSESEPLGLTFVPPKPAASSRHTAQSKEEDEEEEEQEEEAGVFSASSPPRSGPATALFSANSLLSLLPAITGTLEKARALRSSHVRMALEVAALLSQTSKSFSSLSVTCLARTARADDALRHARIVHARQAGEIVALKAMVAEKDADVANAALAASAMQGRILSLETALAKQAMQARCMRDALAEVTGCVRVVIKVRPLLPCDLKEDSVTGVAVRWVLRSYFVNGESRSWSLPGR